LASIATVSVNITGDIGGAGVSRFRFFVVPDAVPSVANCNLAGSSIRAFYLACQALLPADVTTAVQPVVEVNDVVSGAVTALVTMSSVPAALVGSGTGNYGGGLGAGVNLKTSTVLNRRFMRGKLFFVPLAVASYSTNGSVTPATINTINGAYSTYLAAMVAGNLEPAVWHRPPKGTFAGGAEPT